MQEFRRLDLCDNLFCLELGPDFLGIVFSNLSGMHEICVDFWRDSRILVNKSCIKFYFQNFCAVIISHRAQNTDLTGCLSTNVTILLQVRWMVNGFYTMNPENRA